MSTGKIKTLYSDKEKTEALFPRTKTSAISDANGIGLDALIEHSVYADTEAIETTTAPLDADTLGGRLAEEYAIKTNVVPAMESTDYVGCYYRTVDGVTEWINPPMVIGQEYRTTERYCGKPVYAKIIDCGTMPNATKKSIAHGITNYQDIVDLRGTMISSGGTIGFLPMSSGNIETDWNIGVVSDNIFLVTNADRSTWTAKVLIKVTKTTD